MQIAYLNGHKFTGALGLLMSQLVSLSVLPVVCLLFSSVSVGVDGSYLGLQSCGNCDTHADRKMLGSQVCPIHKCSHVRCRDWSV